MGDQSNSTFEDLMIRIAAGSQDAVWEAIEKYSTNIQRAVRRTLSDDLRRKFDSVDIVQSVWKSLLLKDQPLAGLQSPNDFVAYVCRMAQNKVKEANTHYRRVKRRDMRREVPLERPVSGADGQTAGAGEPRRDPTADAPDAIAQMREKWRDSVAKCGPRTAEIIDLRLQCVPDEMIATQLGISPATVRRDVQRLMETFVA